MTCSFLNPRLIFLQRRLQIGVDGGGISHHPDEHVETADADAGARVLLRLVENFRANA